MSSRNSALRRYPAMGYLAGTASLALLLPSGLTVPNSGPPTLAEYAPVPGQGEGQSDTSEVGLPTSGGLGAGGVSGGAGGISAPPPGGEAPGTAGGGGVRRPGTKRCVGSPPRQTEDPLSPPCIAFFDGDNFGATSKGVSGDAVTVIVKAVNDQRHANAGRQVDCLGGAEPEDTSEEHACRAFAAYFNSRYQTYGRQVRLLLDRGTPIETLDEKLKPFAIVSPYGLVGGAARLGIVSAGYDGTTRDGSRKDAPYLITYRPDTEDTMALVASYVCLRLKDRPARFSGNADDHGSPRKFGLWTDDNPSKPDRLIAALNRQCGIKPVVLRRVQDPLIPAQFRADGVTTVLPLFGSTSSYVVAATLASQSGWFPEWVLPGDGDATRIDTNAQGRLVAPEQWRNMVGITVDYRRDRMSEQQWFRAFREGCPGCPTPRDTGLATDRNAPFLYDALSMVFYGIQASGPRLTPANLDRGLHAIPPQGSASPYRPAAYFAPGNYSFVKDATAIWWDPTGVAPGSSGAGCYRLAHGGIRYRSGEWPRGDDAVRAPGPCQGDTLGGS